MCFDVVLLCVCVCVRPEEEAVVALCGGPLEILSEGYAALLAVEDCEQRRPRTLLRVRLLDLLSLSVCLNMCSVCVFVLLLFCCCCCC